MERMIPKVDVGSARRGSRTRRDERGGGGDEGPCGPKPVPPERMKVQINGGSNVAGPGFRGGQPEAGMLGVLGDVRVPGEVLEERIFLETKVRDIQPVWENLKGQENELIRSWSNLGDGRGSRRSKSLEPGDE